MVTLVKGHLFVVQICDGHIALKETFLWHALTVCKISCFYLEWHNSSKYLKISAELIPTLAS